MEKTLKIMIFLTIMLMTFSVVSMTASAATYEEYAPILYFEGEETCFPVDIQYHIDNSVKRTGEFEGSTIEYYDNTHGTIEDTGVIEDYESQSDLYDSVVYYRETTEGNSNVIQYWFFYAFNKGELNSHEGDWEMVQVVIPNTGNKWVAYSQHYSGQSATWNQVEREDNHIKVYISRGSHASFLRSYSGKLGLGMGSDNVGANGRIMENGDYQLVELSDQDWLDFTGFWGEYNGEEDYFLGRVGPQGPQYRQPMDMWSHPVTWGQGLQPANDLMFIFEWLIYNLVTIYIVITIVLLAIIIFKIYRRYKKYGLGPRIVSMLYIDGLNLSTIGNILGIVGIIVAIFGLFNNWYRVSANIDIGGSGTGGVLDIISFDGINGIVINVPTSSGVLPYAAAIVPFSLFLGVGIIFMIISTVGVPKSGKLGGKYIMRGVRLFLPIVLIIIAMLLLGSISISAPGAEGAGSDYITEIMSSISNSPAYGEASILVSEADVSGFIEMSWGIGPGGLYLIIAAIIMIIGGICEFAAHKVFFESKMPVGKTKSVYQPPKKIETSKKEEKKKEEKDSETKENYCTKCGKKIDEGSKFCTKCGEKV